MLDKYLSSICGMPGTFTHMISFNSYKGLSLGIVIILIVI